MGLSVALQHRFPGFALDLRFEAPIGVTAIFGHSGSGKTTLVNALAGLLQPDAGRITLKERVLFDHKAQINIPPHRRRIGYVFQDARLFPHLTVRQNLHYGRWFAPKTALGHGSDQIIALLGLGHLLERRPAHLSGGEKSRVALGRAILSAPELLLLDEPLAALDEARKAEILPYLEQLRDHLALPILYVSHAPAEVARLANTVVMLEKGRILAAGPAQDLLADPLLSPGFGQREAGGLLSAKVIGPDPDGLTRIQTAAGPIWLTETLRPGRQIRLRIMAQDIMLTGAVPPQGLSALNILPAQVQALQPEGLAMLVRLRLGDDVLLARVTRRSAENLQLAPGAQVHAVLKSVVIAPDALGDALGDVISAPAQP